MTRPHGSRPSFALGALALVSLSWAVSACADDEAAPSSASSSSGSATSSSSSGGGAGGGTTTSTSTSSSSSGGGAGGGTTEPLVGVPGADLVNAGTVMNSPSHRLVFTLGQSSPAQQTLQSPSYRVHGGLTGATE